MARPAITDERKEQILSAYERCIVKYGVAGTTLAAIAEESGLSRPLVRHHAGNQEDLLSAALDGFLQRSSKMLKDLAPRYFSNIQEFIDLLFEEVEGPETNDTLIASAFLTASHYDEMTNQQMQNWMKEITEWFYQHIKWHFPDAPEQELRSVSAGVMGIYFNVDSLALFEPISELRHHSRNAVRTLISSLPTPK